MAKYLEPQDLNLRLSDKESDLKVPTYEAYTYRVNRIKEYFKSTNSRLVDITPKIVDEYFKYCLKYGKINQKTHERYSEDLLFLTKEEIGELPHFIADKYPRLLGITFMGA